MELGTYRGFSYLTFCQALASLEVEARAVAVDTWKGDEHMGAYGDDVLRELTERHDSRYGTFSRLLRATFDEARHEFADASVDLLHLDGVHTYEAVRHDFETWAPTLSPRGVLLFHDTNVREAPFGVHRLWSELRERYQGFEFLHGKGLGVLGVGEALPEPVRTLLRAEEDPPLATGIRDAYARLGSAVSAEAERMRLVADSQRQLAESQRQLAESQRRLEAVTLASDERAAGLQARFLAVDAERANVQAELDGVRASKSWALTAPLRSVHRLGHGLRLTTIPSSVRAARRARAFVAHPARAIERRRRPALLRLPGDDELPRDIRDEAIVEGAAAWTAAQRIQSRVTADERDGAPAALARTAKLIAFYLPQFHPIPENDEWWGKGFTEWTNVRRGRPQYAGHHQPRVPGELGYYDLRDSAVMERQGNLAREYGIHGFCFYYYWFDGRRVLERPVDEMLASGSPDLPFCFCWANENWTRRWDGSESEILLRQEYSPGWSGRFIRDLLPAFEDRRYISVDGAPLLLVYCAHHVPDVQRVADEWRAIVLEETGRSLHLAAIQSFGLDDPRPYGFDSAVEFPPHHAERAFVDRREAPGVEPSFEGYLEDYLGVRHALLRRELPQYSWFRGLMTAWDNTPRRGSRGHVLLNATPAAYELWLRKLVLQALCRSPLEEPLVFVNAWNEWAEGAYLEPDERFGREWLEATLAGARDGLRQFYASRGIPLEAHEAERRVGQHDNAVALRAKHPSAAQPFRARCVSINGTGRPSRS